MEGSKYIVDGKVLVHHIPHAAGMGAVVGTSVTYS